MISSDLHETSRNLGKKKKSAWLHVYTPSSPKSYWPPITSLEQFLRAIVLIYPQIKLTTLTLCFFFFFKADSPFGSGTPSDKFPFELAQWEHCLQTCFSESQCVWPPKASQHLHLPADGDQKVYPHWPQSQALKAKDKEQDERKIFGFCTGDPQPNLSK